MNISFDLDSTLIPHGNEFESEPLTKIANWLGIEPIRKGTPALIHQLQEQGHTIHIYTTSFRSKRKIRRTLRYYGIKVNTVVNQTENERVLKSRNIYASKYPPAFQFDLHIDDAKGVGIEGEKFNFKTIIIAPNNNNWSHDIIQNINAL